MFFWGLMLWMLRLGVLILLDKFCMKMDRELKEYLCMLVVVFFLEWIVMVSLCCKVFNLERFIYMFDWVINGCNLRLVCLSKLMVLF